MTLTQAGKGRDLCHLLAVRGGPPMNDDADQDRPAPRE